MFPARLNSAELRLGRRAVGREANFKRKDPPLLGRITLEMNHSDPPVGLTGINVFIVSRLQHGSERIATTSTKSDPLAPFLPLTVGIFTRNVPLIHFLLLVRLQIEVCEKAKKDDSVRAKQDAKQSGMTVRDQDRNHVDNDQHELSLSTNIECLSVVTSRYRLMHNTLHICKEA